MLISHSTLFTLLLCLVPTGEAILRLPKNVTVPAVFAFGDSIVDTGNNNHIPTLIKADFPPYGKDYAGGVPTGRFCDGKVPPDIIAEELGIKEAVPAYFDRELPPEELITGVSFASGGSGYDPVTSKSVSVISLSQQLESFKEYIEKLKGIVGVEEAKFILANSIYIVVASSDDIANTYFVLHARLQYDFASYTDLLTQSASEFLKGLYELGCRRIAVFSAPPIGCVPSQRTLGGGIERECSSAENYVASLFNAKLSNELNSLNSKLLNSKMVYIDVFNSLLDIIEHPQKHGFEVADRGCCGTGELEVAVLCNRLSETTCEDVSKYVFWDSYHPTEKTYKVIVYQLLEIYAPKFF